MYSVFTPEDHSNQNLNLYNASSECTCNTCHPVVLNMF